MEGLTELFPMHKQTVLRWNNLSVTFCVNRTTDQTPFHVNWDVCLMSRGKYKCQARLTS